MVAKVDPKICVGCRACVGVCPVKAIKMEKLKEFPGSIKAVVDEDLCIDCGACVNECPVKAIELD